MGKHEVRSEWVMLGAFVMLLLVLVDLRPHAARHGRHDWRRLSAWACCSFTTVLTWT
jgi:hypothetical protein